MVENEVKDLNLIYSKIKSFIECISSIKNNISEIPDIPNGSFGLLNPLKLYLKYSKRYKKINDIVMSQIYTFMYSFKFATTKSFILFNEIKCD